MSHPRQRIREQVTAQLAADATLAALGWTFVESEALPQEEADLPQGLIYTGTDTIRETLEDLPRQELHDLELVVALVAQAKTGNTTQDDLDAAAVLVEKVVYRDPTLGLSAMIAATDGIGSDPVLDGSGQRITGALAMRFRVTYVHTVS